MCRQCAAILDSQTVRGGVSNFQTHTVKAGTVSACCGVVWTNLDQILTFFFLGFCCCTRPSWCPECAPCVGLHGGAAVRLIKNSKGSKKNSKRAKKELKTGRKRMKIWFFENWFLGSSYVRNDKIRCLTERISLIRRRWCAMREQVLVFLGTPPQLEYSVTKLVTLSH